MSQTDDARRKFLLGAALGAGAAASSGTLIADANAQAQTPATGSPASEPGIIAAANRHCAFFNEDNASAVEAFAERILPGAPGLPGARDANVLNYIDLALAGAYADQQDFYRRGLSQLEAFCQANYKESFATLKPAQQDEVLTALESGKATEFVYPTAQAFFNTLRVHTIEGMFADPLYGGNKDFAGWRLIGFPGAQPVYTTQDMQATDAFTRVPIQGLQTQARSTVRR